MGVAGRYGLTHPILLSLATLFFFIFLSACHKTESEQNESAGKRRITVTFEPQRWIVEQIAGNDFDVNVLLPPGADPESYSPTVAQLRSLYDGGEWLSLNTMGVEQSLLANLTDNGKEIKVENVAIGIKPLEHSHGKSPQEPHHHDESDSHDHNFADPHLWNSVRNMEVIAANTLRKLIALNPEKEKTYRKHYDSLYRQLRSYDDTLSESLRWRGTRAFVIRHPSLGYLARDYGLEQIAIQAEEKEPSAIQMRERIDRANESGASVMVTESGKGDDSSARELARQLHLRLLPINTNSMLWPEEILKLKDL